MKSLYIILGLSFLLFSACSSSEEGKVQTTSVASKSNAEGIKNNEDLTTQKEGEFFEIGFGPMTNLGEFLSAERIAERYAFIYLPSTLEKKLLSEKNQPKRTPIIGAPIRSPYVSFSISELLNQSFLESDYEYDKEDLFIMNFFREVELEKTVLPEFKRGLIALTGRNVFLEEMGEIQCNYFLERVTNDYVSFYASCGKKDEMKIQDSTHLTNNQLNLELQKLQEKRLGEIKDKANQLKKEVYYYAFQGTIRKFEKAKNKDYLIATIYPITSEAPLGSSRISSCEQIGNQPLLFCEPSSPGEGGKLFFLETKRFDELSDCYIGTTVDLNIEEGVVKIQCQASDNNGTIRSFEKKYDLKGSVISGE